jgi:hypothetical protein
MSISISISACPTLASIPADRLHAVTGGAAPATLPNGEPNGVLTGGPAPVTAPGPVHPSWTTQDAPFARENSIAQLRQWVTNADTLVTLQKAGWFDLGRRF